MKKNYFFVLVALLSFALCSYAQDDTTQDETYNMTVKLPDGTTLSVNTDDVDEVTFSNGVLSVTGTRIDEIVAKLKQIIEEFNSYGVDVQEAKAYIERLVVDLENLQNAVERLNTVAEDNMKKTEQAYDYAIRSLELGVTNKEDIYKHEAEITDLKECVKALQVDMAALKTAIASIPACSCADLTGQLAALEAELADTKALSQYAMNMSQEANVRGEKAQETAEEALQRAYEAHYLAERVYDYVRELQEAYATMLSHINNLTTTVADQDARIVYLQEEVRMQKEKNAALEARVSMLEEMLKNVEEKLDWQLGVKEQKND